MYIYIYVHIQLIKFKEVETETTGMVTTHSFCMVGVIGTGLGV